MFTLGLTLSAIFVCFYRVATALLLLLYYWYDTVNLRGRDETLFDTLHSSGRDFVVTSHLHFDKDDISGHFCWKTRLKRLGAVYSVVISSYPIPLDTTDYRVFFLYNVWKQKKTVQYCGLWSSIPITLSYSLSMICISWRTGATNFPNLFCFNIRQVYDVCKSAVLLLSK